MFPYARVGWQVRMECATQHQLDVPLTRDPAVVRAVQNWIAKREAQLHTQHERWGTDDDVKRSDA
jgi:hypothetical protein